MSDKGAMVAGSIGRLGINGRLVYVQHVTRFVAYVISFPEQHDTSFDLDRRFIGPTHAIATSPFIDFYTIDINALSSRNLDFLETLTDGAAHDYKVMPGISKITVHGTTYKSGDIVSLTPLQAYTYGSRVVEKYLPNVEKVEPVIVPILGPTPLRLEAIHAEKLGTNYLKIYSTIKNLGKPTLEEAAKATLTTNIAQAEWHINNLIRLGNLRWTD